MVNTYRYHLAKLRCYCERELGRPPSHWSMRDICAFTAYLAALPASSLRTVDDWLRPTFAMTSLMTGQDIRTVAT